MQLAQPLVAEGAGPVPQLGQQVRPPLGQVGDPRRHAVRVQAQPQHVDRRLEQRRRAALALVPPAFFFVLAALTVITAALVQFLPSGRAA